MNFRLRFIGLILQVSIIVALIGCGASAKKKSNHSTTPKQEVGLEVDLKSKEEAAGLALAGGASYSADIVGCKSGLTFPLLG